MKSRFVSLGSVQMKERYDHLVKTSMHEISLKNLDWPGIGIEMRPEVLRRKQRGNVAYWQFRKGLPKVHPGRRL